MTLPRVSNSCQLCDAEMIPYFPKEHQNLITLRTKNTELRAHYFCLLFSSGLSQRGTENEGLQGFLATDVKSELKRGARLKCVYCKKKGATVGCAKPQCKKSYHLPCGMTNNSLQQYYDQFKSFCSTHRPVQKIRQIRGSPSNRTDICSICQEEVNLAPSSKAIWTPCCGAFFHQSCIQNAALSAGAFHFRCPLCNNEEKFVPEMHQFGIYIPTSDASWEEIEDRPSREKRPECRALVCFCEMQEHRFYDSVDSLWEILACYACGEKGIHAKCGGLDDYVDPHWYCYTCRRIDSCRPPTDKTADRPIVEIWGTAFGKKQNSSVAKSSEQRTEETPKCSEVVDRPLISFATKVPIRNSADLMNVTLEEIIVKGLDEKLRETSYKSQLFATRPKIEPMAAPSITTKAPVRKSPGSSNSPGDSDYESAQEPVVPFKLRKANTPEVLNRSEPVITSKASVMIHKASPIVNGSAQEKKLFIDQRIEKSIKEFFREGAN